MGGHDASDMEYLHVDLWTLSTSAIKVSPINSGEGPGDALQTISHTIGSWTSVDIPIGDFTGMTWDNVIQMKFDGGNGTTDASVVPLPPSNFIWMTLSQVIPVKSPIGISTLVQEPMVCEIVCKASPGPSPEFIGLTLIAEVDNVHKST